MVIGHHHSERGCPLCLLQVMLSGGWDKTVQVWDQRAGPLAVRSLYGPFICGDALDLEGDRVLTGEAKCSMLGRLCRCRFSAIPVLLSFWTEGIQTPDKNPAGLA